MRSTRTLINEFLKAPFLRLLLATLCGVAVAQYSFAAAAAAATGEQAAPTAAHALEQYRQQALVFEPNRGQTDPQVDFVARGAAYTAFLTANEAVLVLRTRGEPAVVRMAPVDANPAPRVQASKLMPGTVNHANGDDPKQWVSVATYAEVTYDDVYPGIDLVYHGNQGQLEYDFVVAPGADPGQIRLAFDGVSELQVDAQGGLVLHTAAGSLHKPQPVIYQEVDGVRHVIAGRYVIDERKRVGFALQPYDRTRTLVIDPTFVHSTYLGGSSDESDPLYGSVVGVAVDAAGNAYVAGTTMSSNFPTTSGADRIRNGNQDAFVTKFSPTGAMLYSTYLGGACDDVVRGIAVSAAGEAYITGRAHDRCYQASPGVLVAKIGPSGAPAYFHTFGGTLADTSIGQAIAVDASGQAYVTGLAKASSRDFPTTPSALRGTDCNGYLADGFVAKVNAAGNGLLYSTYLCGNDHDSPNAIAIDSAGNAYIAGSTVSRDFPTRNAYQPTHRGTGPANTNAFVTKLNASGSALVYSTYLGGWWDTAAHGIAVDAAGQAHITGSTMSDDFPTTAGVVQRTSGIDCSYGICRSDAFVTKLSAGGSALVYSTFLHGEGSDAGIDIAVDAAGNAYVAGETASLNFPILNAAQNANRGLRDGFVAKLNSNATRLLYSSYLGGGKRPGSSSTTEGADGATGIALLAATGEVVVAGYTSSLNFPTASAFQPNPGGGVCFVDGTPCGDAFVAKLTAGGAGVIPPVRVGVSPTEVAPGGTINATWAGIPTPTGRDELRLYPLGALADGNAVASWPASGTASGSRTLTLPIALAPANYELRLLSPDSNYSGLLGTIARSQPIYVRALPDLIEIGLSNPPASVVLGATFSATDTVRNYGTVSAGASATRYYLSLDTLKSTGDMLLGGGRAVPGLAAGAQSTGTVQLSVPVGIASNSYFLLACADDPKAVAEGSETNNCRASGTKVAVR